MTGEEARADESQAHENLPYEQARLAYRIIEVLLEHTRVTQDLVALMAQVIDEDTQRALTNTPHWSAYMDSRRAMERASEDIERFAQVWTRLSEEAEEPDAPSREEPVATPREEPDAPSQ